MYSAPVLGWKYLQYYLTAHNGKGHGVHSPFVFRFITEVLNDDRRYYAYSIIEPLRRALKANKTWIELPHSSADRRRQFNSEKANCAIAPMVQVSPKLGQLLFRMVGFFQPASILELGSTLGITTAYLASANSTIPVTSMEDTEVLAAQALQVLRKAGVSNATLITGNIEQTLPTWLSSQKAIDFVFVTDSHSYASTMRYFYWLRERAHAQSVLVFNGIHRSAAMEQAWAHIQADSAVTLTIDLFFIGVVFFRPEQQQKEHFSIRF